jgi:hypothetical protein
MNKNIKKGKKAKLREEYFIETNIFPLDNLNRYNHWIEDKLVKNLSLSGVVGPSEQLVCDKEELDCPYDFTSICTMGRCDCEIKAK